MSERTPVISLGAGVQSSAMLLMAAAGEFDDLGRGRPELAVFADTQWEPAEVYEWLTILKVEALKGGIEVVSVTAGNLREDTAATAAGAHGRFASPPLYIRHPKRHDAAALRRQCTKDYKLKPIWRELRSRGYGPTKPVEQWLGISLDEVQRMKPSSKVWASVWWPLIEKRLDRRACMRWLEEHGYPVPRKSACIGCPYHDDGTWRDMKLNRPEEFADAAAWDRQLRHLPRLEGEAFIHRSLQPLDEVDLSSREDRGQLTLTEMDECEGGCFL